MHRPQVGSERIKNNPCEHGKLKLNRRLGR
jgi:hypothetical protein